MILIPQPSHPAHRREGRSHALALSADRGPFRPNVQQDAEKPLPVLRQAKHERIPSPSLFDSSARLSSSNGVRDVLQQADSPDGQAGVVDGTSLIRRPAARPQRASFALAPTATTICRAAWPCHLRSHAAPGRDSAPPVRPWIWMGVPAVVRSVSPVAAGVVLVIGCAAHAREPRGRARRRWARRIDGQPEDRESCSCSCSCSSTVCMTTNTTHEHEHDSARTRPRLSAHRSD